MMKRIVLCLLLFALCPCSCFAAYLIDGEYEISVWLENYDELIVIGGGAYEIIAKGNSYVEVQYTSTPLGFNIGGILDIAIDDYSNLLYLDGLTGEISIYDNATAILKGGRIDYIRSRQHVFRSPHITIESLDGWSWMESSGDIFGITGQWADGAAFDIEFFDDASGYYNPTWENINVVVVPEPATLLLISVGAIILRKRRK